MAQNVFCKAKHVVSRILNGIEQVKHIFIGVSESIDQPHYGNIM